ncbi:MAG: D-glycero-beta-D-manno-heptose 1-phosphate adenylyltransferase [Candidatus Omnitrophica bacterium]|nr:D-glycero-beta-D-manno-heptose 1-phosphate adenylyltransferase [Candidatus Omnitrophota bacterium]
MPRLSRPRGLAVATRKKTVAFTNGCFDILHAGHVDYLEKVKRLADVLVVGLNSDASVRRLKGPGRPVNAVEDRARVLLGLKSVDRVVVFEEDTPERLIRKVRPDLLAKGADWKAGDIVGGDFVKSYGGKVVRIPLLKGRSTTGTISKSARFISPVRRVLRNHPPRV